MSKICFYAHRHLVHFFVLVIITSTVSYLIVVSTPDKKFEGNFKRKFTNNLNVSGNNYELRERGLKNSIQSSHFFKRTTQGMGFKVILTWSPLFKDWNFLASGKNSFKDSGCRVTRCEITSDRKRLLESDAVLFHVRTMSMFDLPTNRTQGQKWIFFSLEAPPYSRFQGFDFMTGMFNWTMTYRKDSDVIIPYGRIVPKTDTFRTSYLHENWRNKTKMAVWMVSHCLTDGNRESYIDELSGFIEVDTFGGCGLGTCPFNKTNLCIEKFSTQYHFFLAFENAICDDYITEKLYRTLQFDLIPVVFGGGQYSDAAPPHSFINAMDFSSPKHLASHMLRVASNFTLFSSFFKWRESGYSDDTPNHCELCQKLHSEDFVKHSVYLDVNEWWIKKSHCKRWTTGNRLKAL